MDKKRKSEVNAAAQPKPKMKKRDIQAIPLFGWVLTVFVCYLNDLFAVTDRTCVPTKISLSITEMKNWIPVDSEVSSELGRRSKLEHNQLRLPLIHISEPTRPC